MTLSLKYDVNIGTVPSKSNNDKYFVGALKVIDEKSRLWIRLSEFRILGSLLPCKLGHTIVKPIKSLNISDLCVRI
jgi:hypothetical protein